MHEIKWKNVFITVLLIANIITPFAMWDAAQNYVWTETEVLLGAVNATNATSGAQTFQRYLAADESMRADYALKGEQVMELAGYSYSAPKYVKGRLSQELMPVMVFSLLIGVSLETAILYRTLCFQRHIMRLQRKKSETENQLRSTISNHEILLKDIAHYEENLYHQLKTPLTSLQLCLEQLQPLEGKYSPNGQAYQTAKMQIQKLSRLISLFLRDRKLSSNAIKFHHHLVALDFLIEDAVKQLQTQAEFRHITIHQEIPECDSFLRCDETWLSECVLTLLENAIEHSPEQCTIKVGLTREPRRYRLKVFSPGVQLAPNESLTIFERFHSSSPGHFGIGLAMARTIAENHHGELIAYNADKKLQGVYFELVLPILEGPETYNVTDL